MKTIFLVLDTVRRDYLAAYGNTWVHTPNLSKLAQAGITFDNHWVGSLPCMPARREFMTGRYNFVYRGWGPIEPYDDVLPRELREKTGTFSHLLTDHQHYFELGGENYHTGFNTWEFFRGQEYDPWVSLVDAIAVPDWSDLGKRDQAQIQQNFKNRERQVQEGDFSGPRTVQAAIDWVEANRAADNWFLQVELFDPHEPFYCTEEYRELYHDTWDGPVWDWPDYDIVRQDPAAVEHVRKCYAGLLTMSDRWADKLFAKLEELGLWDETVIVFTTDHGTMLGEHEWWMKLNMPLYNEIARIPLIMKWPGNVRAGERFGGLTQTIDLMPTFLDFYGAPYPPHLHGRSIKGMLDGTGPLREDALFGYFGMATNVTDGRHVYLRNPINADGGPLHAYTAMPVAGLNRWFPREVHEKTEMGRYFGHTYNFPLYKIPVNGRVPNGEGGQPVALGQNQLFDVLADPGQLSPITDPVLEAQFAAKIVRLLGKCEAPAEQYTRLGLEPAE